MNTLSDIYQQYAPDIYRFALGLSGDLAWADDITAETFVRAMVSARPIRMETVKGYLFTIARNVYLEALRKNKRLVRLDEGVVETAVSVEAQAEAKERLENVLACLQKLPEVDRSALIMRVQHELPYTAVAQALNISVSSAKVKVHRARAKLTHLLKEQDQ